MRDKLQLYTVIADYTASHLTDSWQQWTAFLATASRLYKYSYYDQLIIFHSGRRRQPTQNLLFGMML